MNFIDYANGSVSLVQIKRLLSFAVGEATNERVNSILHETYSDSKTVLYVLADNDAALGVIGLKRLGDSGEILHIAVAERKRKQGLGRQMIDCLAKLGNLRELVAETDRDGLEFYIHCGFSIRSLGEKYPGIERFQCRLEVKRWETTTPLTGFELRPPDS